MPATAAMDCNVLPLVENGPGNRSSAVDQNGLVGTLRDSIVDVKLQQQQQL
jgi:hypothetical protein